MELAEAHPDIVCRYGTGACPSAVTLLRAGHFPQSPTFEAIAVHVARSGSVSLCRGLEEWLDPSPCEVTGR